MEGPRPPPGGWSVRRERWVVVFLCHLLGGLGRRAEIGVLASHALVEVEDIDTCGFKVGRGIVRRGHEDIVRGTIIGGHQHGRHRGEPDVKNNQVSVSKVG